MAHCAACRHHGKAGDRLVVTRAFDNIGEHSASVNWPVGLQATVEEMPCLIDGRTHLAIRHTTDRVACAVLCLRSTHLTPVK